MKLDSKLIAVIFVLLVALPMTLAQDVDTEAYDVIQQAIDALGDGYAYSSNVTVSQTFIGEQDGFGTVTSLLATGQVDADGNYHVMQSLQAGESSDTVDESSIFHIQLLSMDDTPYVRFENIAEAYPVILGDLEDGWHSVDELLSMVAEDSAEQLIIHSLTAITLPADLPLTGDMILSVEEQDPITMDGVDIRVFDVETDALQVFIEQNRGIGSLEAQLEMILAGGSFLTESEFVLTYTLWIGADDGLWYGGQSTGHTKLAYRSSGQMDILYDIVTDMQSEFTITQHGTVEAITLPEELD